MPQNNILAGSNELALSWGDQGNGYYRNPILFADFSDPDIIRVGDDFYLIASDFHFMGMQILHARDLVNWQVIGQVYDRMTIASRYDTMQAYGRGVWAPSLRFHAGSFYIYACTPDEGLLMWQARDPRGPWSTVHLVHRAERWEDPCPFWDDDGSAYLVRGRLGAGPLFLHRMTPDGRQLLDDGQEIYYGRGAEGPKMFKRHGWYYISLPENGVARGGQTLIRSRKPYGPYERKVILSDGNPHQGGMVELECGEGWFIGFKSRGWSGRVCHLIPYRWQDDDWPLFGVGPDPDETPFAWKKPAAGTGDPPKRPSVDDPFAGPEMNPIWQWNHNPVPGYWSLEPRRNALRLRALPAASPDQARNTLTQKLWDTSGIATVSLDATEFSIGQRAGLAFLCGREMARVGMCRKANGDLLPEYGPAAGDACTVSLPTDAGPNPSAIWLRGTYMEEACELAFSFDGRRYTTVPIAFRLSAGAWKGARIALYSYGEGEGDAYFSAFRLTYGPHLQACRTDESDTL